METPSFSYKLESRPGQLLIDHLTNTSNACLKSIQTTAFTFGPETEPDVLGHVAGLIGFTHDMGKATVFFQNYINEELAFGKCKYTDTREGAVRRGSQRNEKNGVCLQKY